MCGACDMCGTDGHLEEFDVGDDEVVNLCLKCRAREQKARETQPVVHQSFGGSHGYVAHDPEGLRVE